MLKSVSLTPRAFASGLLKWNREANHRQMPWKGERDPYRIWLSEIILQQTRVGQGLKYYQAFLFHFPDIHLLANSPEEKVFKIWEGLGYYSRCRNLIHTARYISREKKGDFPADYTGLRKLKGVGPYTAAAIASFAFGLPHAVVDGNVSRVLARIYGISEPVNSAKGKKAFEALATRLLDKKDPAAYNQAIMDFGATICRPAAPICSECIFRSSCFAFNEKRIGEFPVKEKKAKPKERWFCYLVFHHGDKIAIQQRTGNDIWQNLFEFPYWEMGDPAAGLSDLAGPGLKEILPYAPEPFHSSKTYKQQLTHQAIHGRFLHFRLHKKPGSLKNVKWIKLVDADRIAFPKIVRQYLFQMQSGTLIPS